MKLPLTPIRFLYRARDQFGDKTGVIDSDQSWTYRQYAERCHRLAALLLSWGTRPLDRIAFLSYNSHHLLEGYYGVLLARGILLPLNIRLTSDDFRFILQDAGVEILFFHPDFAAVVEQLRESLPAMKRWVPLESYSGPDWIEARGYEELIDKCNPVPDLDYLEADEDSVAEIFYTSGTTGSPKGVMLTHRNLYLHALEVLLALRYTDSEVVLHTIPLFHVNGWGTPQCLTCAGGTHVMMSRFEAASVFTLIARHKVTALSLVPTMAVALLQAPQRRDYRLESLQTITLGGSAANPTLVRDLEEAFGCECLAGYGLTETSPVLTLSRPKAHLGLEGERLQAVKAMTGYPIPGVDLRLLDAEERELPWDGVSVGEVVVRADGVMAAYWNRSEETAEALRGDWFHTGDMAVIDPDGYVLIVDRKKDLIISGGENISSLEVEKTLLSHSAVLECAVIPVPDETWGEVPKALVVLKDGREVDDRELIDYCRKRLAGFKVPRSVEFFETLPKGGTGKILKWELRERYWTAHSKRVS